MGIITTIRNNIKNKVVMGAENVSNKLSTLSQLSPLQVDEVNKKRKQYLSQMPSMDDEKAKELIQRNLGAIGIEVHNAYLSEISSLYLPIEEKKKFDAKNRIAYFEITRWVKDPNEDNIEKLMNVYQVLSGEECNIALIYDRKVDGSRIYLAVVNNGTDGDSNEVVAYIKRLFSALKGNFPGVQCKKENGREWDFSVNVPDCLRADNQEGTPREPRTVATASNLATEKSEKFICQTIEKVLDGIVPSNEKDEYTMLLLATPVRGQMARSNRLYELYTELAPYAGWQTNYTYTETTGNGKTTTGNINLGLHGGFGIGKNIGSNNTQTGSAPGIHVGASAGVGINMASNVMVTLGANEGITQSFTNYGVKHTLEILEKQVKRFEESKALGLWDFAAYVLSEDSIVANNVAHTYLALTQGQESFLAESAVNLWRADLPEERDLRHEKNQAANILKALSRLQHPEFCLPMDSSGEILQYPACVNATVSLSGKEMARAMNLPSKSVCGLSVIETASFGRNIASYNEKKSGIAIGNIYHMHARELQSEVSLDKDSLTAHTFITGSTGTGKSNTVYQLLDKLQEQGCKYMVIEPAKGEYKDVFGGYADVSVYGTNPMKTGKLLQINPFSFPEEIHVLEHIDRLIEIFNACWPMYAAMPAVLKDAVEKAYEKYGWHLRTSSCVRREFPNFGDLLEELPKVLEGSYFSGDTKGDYEGALITRVKSMTNGINGLVLCPECETTDEELFENNVIVDISRVGSTETKSLYMGILVMKLQEHRMRQASQGKTSNQGLRHVTVLEEAHNLLRKTSVSQSQEGANLQGKSVEMITNAIAEMRTYGEGFIIADQAPIMLDETVIRNTNTKIILRLPDGDDRELVGKAVALSDNQIQEIAKLPKGVAVVYQNDWVEAVLCQFEKFPKEKQKVYSFVADSLKKGKDNVSRNFFNLFFERKKLSDFETLECDAMKKWVNGLKVNPYTKRHLYDCMEGKKLAEDVQRNVMYNLFNGKSIAKKLETTFDETTAIDAVEKMIYAKFDLQDYELSRIICRYVVDSICRQLEEGNLANRFKDYDWRKIR